jgi:hypothetical protein
MSLINGMDECGESTKGKGKKGSSKMKKTKKSGKENGKQNVDECAPNADAESWAIDSGALNRTSNAYTPVHTSKSLRYRKSRNLRKRQSVHQRWIRW